MNNGIWIGIDERELFSPACLMKVPVMIALLKQAQVDPGILNRELVYDSVPYKMEEFTAPHEYGKSYSVDYLLRETIRTSDNIATMMLV